jgi:GH25 family lysozyme M1 (1,4-beta-N-acetylmuramidase)
MRGKQRIKRAGCLLMALMMILTGTALAAFSDTSGNWAQAAIDKWSGQYGILQGYSDGTFRPDRTITRGAFAAIMVRLLQYQTASPAETFSDTPGTWCENEVLKLHAAGVYLGDAGKANILAKISRQQAVTMIGRAFGIAESTADLNYADASSVMSYSRGYIAAMAEKGYLTDTPSGGKFRPAEPITRAEVVNILNNMVDTLIQQSGTHTANISGTALINASDVTLKSCTITGDLIIAPGVSGTVTLQDVKLTGNVRNLGSAVVKKVTTPTTSTGYITYGSNKIPILTELEKCILSSGDFAWADRGRLNYLSNDFNTRFGIDVSAYQNRATTGGIDWSAVAADGVQFALVRVGLRGTSVSGNLYADTYYKQNLQGAIGAGIETGAYFFSQATTVEEAQEEANYVVNLLQGYQITGPVAFDWERSRGNRNYNVSKATATACAQAFCQIIKDAGYKPMVYAGKDVGYLKFDLSALKEYPLWYPEYPSSTSSAPRPTFYYQMDYWQYSSKASVSGIGGNVDVSMQFLRK